MELDPEKVTNNMDEAALQAEILKGMQGEQQPQPRQGGQPPAGANPLDPTGAGGGTIGTGQAPVPGEQGFSAPQNPSPGPQQQDPAAMDQLQQLTSTAKHLCHTRSQSSSQVP